MAVFQTTFGALLMVKSLNQNIKQNLNYQIKSRVILEEINIRISKGEFLAIIGPNGAGKSTLLKLMLNLIPLQQGEIFFNHHKHTDFLKNNHSYAQNK